MNPDHQSNIRDYRESEPEISTPGPTATAFYNLDMTWEMDGNTCQESGGDFFGFTHKIYHSNKSLLFNRLFW